MSSKKEENDVEDNKTQSQNNLSGPEISVHSPEYSGSERSLSGSKRQGLDAKNDRISAGANSQLHVTEEPSNS